MKMSATNSSGASNCSDQQPPNFQEGHVICSSLVDISDGKGRPLPRRLTLTSTHLIIQKNSIVTKESSGGGGGGGSGGEDVDSTRPTHGSVSDRGFSADGSFDSFVDTDSPPPESNKREVTLCRVEGVLGISVRGGAEHSLPIIVSRLAPNSPAATCKQIFVGDAIIAINGVKVTKMDHDSAVDFLSSSGPTVTLKLKYFPTAKPYLSPTQNLLETNLQQWEVCEDVGAESVLEHWEMERGIPLTFAFVTRYLGNSDRLRCNAFEVRDSTGNMTTGVVHCADPFSLTSWSKCISDAISGLNSYQIKLWSQEALGEIFYIGWISEGTRDKCSDNITQAWLSWKPKILCFRGNHIYYMQYPPGVGGDWDCSGSVHLVITTLLRVISASSEQLDERQHSFTLQIAIENEAFPSNTSLTKPQPITLYLSTETRQELIKIETAWAKAVTASVKATKKCTYPVWWGGKPCQLELDYPASAFNLYRSSSIPAPPIWSRQFSSLKGSSDDSRTRLTLKFHGNNSPSETMECRDLHRVLFTIHSFLLAKVIH